MQQVTLDLGATVIAAKARLRSEIIFGGIGLK